MNFMLVTSSMSTKFSEYFEMYQVTNFSFTKL